MEHDREEPPIRELNDIEIDNVSGGASAFVVRAKFSQTFPTTGA